MSEKEFRSAPLELRAATENEPAKLVGYAAVFNSLSEDLGGFREVVLPTAFNRAMTEGHDVRAFVNHNPDSIIGRSKAGTLAMKVDERGLHVEITPTDTAAGREVLANVKAGNYDQMSFAFRTITDNWRMQDGQAIRELVDLELFDVSVVAYPAYPGTTVSARALEYAKAATAPVVPPGVPAEVNAARLKLSGL